MTGSRDGGASRPIEGLLDLMARLRDPATGCAWDVEQTHETLAPYAIEEAYEVADAIRRGDLDDLRDELGDLLLQVVFHARVAEEAGAFAFGDVVEAISAKLVRRHPHVFGDARDLSPEEVKASWAVIKAAEKAEQRRRRGGPEPASALDGAPAGLPALLRADRLAKMAAAVGFTWPDASAVLPKVVEEVDEVRDALAQGDSARVADEVGDLLFTAANLARLAGIDPEAALAGANAKFERRFRAVEAELAEAGRGPAEASLDEMERLWAEAKRRERAP